LLLDRAPDSCAVDDGLLFNAHAMRGAEGWLLHLGQSVIRINR
jgi:hypothetical protein